MSVIGSAIRSIDNRLNTAATLVRQGADVNPLLSGMRTTASEHTELRGVASALSSGASVLDSMAGARRALDDAAQLADVRLGANRVSGGSGGAASGSDSPVGIVDGHPTNALGDIPRDFSRGYVGPDGQGFGSMGEATGSRGFEDYSDIF